MGLRFSGVVFDSARPTVVADFWQQALGWTGRETGDRGEVVIFPQQGETEVGPPSIVFQPVPEARAGKNRVHLDFAPEDQRAEVSRLESLGARRVDVGQADGLSFVVMADVEGNEFCVLRD